MTDKIKLVETCGACPEQYDVYIDGELLGFMNLRHGVFRAEYRGTIVFTCQPEGDGIFECHERVKWLNKACREILTAHQQYKLESEEPIYELEN